MTPLFFLNLKVMFEKVNGLGVLLWEVKGLWRLHKELLGKRAALRENESYEFREPASPYRCVFGPENSVLRLENSYFWSDII